ncbi:MAG: IS66 family transposase, partial [Pseudomonadales bacterium]|nr:IS66 family transposase [Pseudomonadales bacterium]
MNDATKALEQKDQQIARLSEQVTALQQQLDWFKRQLFGRKSERQVPDNSQQGSLFDSLPQAPQDHSEPPSPDTSPTRRSSRKKRQSSDVNDTGLRFDESVPQRIIEIPAPELSGPDAEHYEVISHEDTCRLAQEGGYVVLIYRRQVVRHKQHQTLTTAAAPSNVLEGCYADVSYLAGLMVDKAVYHLPLYRQHQRLLDSGVTVSRSTLINWIQKGIELLRPIYRAQWQHILDSGVLAMDEVPIKAGVKKGAGKTPGKMKQSYFWPIYGDQDEMAFTWSPGRGMVHAVEQLKGFSGTLLTDGYTAYTRAVQKLNAEELLIEHANCWAHCRRAFEKALQYEPDGAQQALDQIAKLYGIEKHLREKELDSDESLNYRQQYSE